VTSILDAHFDTGIDQNSNEIGRVAVSKLAGLIHENETGLPQTIRRTAIAGTWVQGKSLPPQKVT
ncbi:MAG: LacI family transcriptional regulator, partial [Lentimonas sp.]